MLTKVIQEWDSEARFQSIEETGIFPEVLTRVIHEYSQEERCPLKDFIDWFNYVADRYILGLPQDFELYLCENSDNGRWYDVRDEKGIQTIVPLKRMAGQPTWFTLPATSKQHYCAQRDCKRLTTKSCSICRKDFCSRACMRKYKRQNTMCQRQLKIKSCHPRCIRRGKREQRMKTEPYYGKLLGAGSGDSEGPIPSPAEMQKNQPVFKVQPNLTHLRIEQLSDFSDGPVWNFVKSIDIDQVSILRMKNMHRWTWNLVQKRDRHGCPHQDWDEPSSDDSCG